MKAIILAAGKGTRMRELTNELPKPMLRYQGKPILEHIVAGIVAAGVRDIFIVTGWRAEVIENHFGDGKKWNARIAFGRQVVQDGTGKAPELAKDFIGDSPFLLTYGDILVPPETYPQMLRRFGEGDFAGVITVTRGEDATKGGLNFFDEQFCLKRLVEKPSREQLEQLRRDGWLKPGAPAWYNAGIYIFRPALFDFTARLQKSPRGEYELTDAISAMVAARQKLAGLEIQGRWVDVRDPETLARLEREVSLAGSVAAPYEIGTWRGFRPAAISYTFDDGCSNQFAVAIPMFNAKGFKLTLFSVVGATSGMFPGWSKLQNAAAEGHEIASHTMTHPNLGQLPDSQQTTELKNSQDAINANISGQKCLTLAYPYCVEANEAITSQYYIAARTCSGQIVPGTPANFMNISSFVCGSQGPVRTTQDFNSKANDAVTAKGWCVFLIHGIDNDGGYSPVSTATLQGSIDYMSTNKDKFWVETFGNVARYILERNAASVKETSSRDDSITLRVTDNLADSIFNHPLTLRRPLPTNWPAAIVSQNNKPVSAQIVDVASKKYVMFDVVPDGGDVIISKHALRQTPAAEPDVH